MSTMANIRKCLQDYLVVGKKYRLIRKILYDKREGKNEFEWYNKTKRMTCIGIYQYCITFEDSSGKTESFTYADTYKMLFGTEEK